MRATVIVAFVSVSFTLAADPKGSPAIEKQLNSKVASERIKGIQAVAALGVDGDMYADSLCTAILDSNPAVGKAAFATLEKIRPDLHKHISTYLLDSSFASKGVTIRALGAMEEKAQPAIGFLIAATKTEIARQVIRRPLGGNIGEDLVKAVRLVGKDGEDTVAFFHQLTATPKAPPWSIVEGLDYLVIWAGDDEMRRKKIVPNLAANVTTQFATNKCITTLGNYGALSSAHLETLKKLKLSSDGMIRTAATEAVEKIETAMKKK